MPRSISRSGRTATSSRSACTTTRTATISSVRFRCGPISQSPTNLGARVPGSDATNRFPLTRAERDYTIVRRCQANQVARRGVADAAEHLRQRRSTSAINPSNTGNVRINRASPWRTAWS